MLYDGKDVSYSRISEDCLVLAMKTARLSGPLATVVLCVASFSALSYEHTEEGLVSLYVELYFLLR